MMEIADKSVETAETLAGLAENLRDLADTLATAAEVLRPLKATIELSGGKGAKIVLHGLVRPFVEQAAAKAAQEADTAKSRKRRR